MVVPVKSFTSGKRRLSELLGEGERAGLNRALARHTVGVILQAGAVPVVVTDDPGEWADGIQVVPDPGIGLDGAVRDGVAWATAEGMRWLVCHADLPFLTADDIHRAGEAVAAGRPVIAPSSDGGTSLLGTPQPGFEFAYGPGSFHRHLARLAPSDPLILNDTGFLLDVDDPTDLATAIRHPRGAWLRLALPG